MATTYGAMEKFKLPKTGLQWATRKRRSCGQMAISARAGVTPDIAIRVPAVQTPEDEVLRQAVAIARETQPAQQI